MRLFKWLVTRVWLNIVIEPLKRKVSMNVEILVVKVICQSVNALTLLIYCCCDHFICVNYAKHL